MPEAAILKHRSTEAHSSSFTMSSKRTFTSLANKENAQNFMAVSQNMLVPPYQDVNNLFMADLEEKMSSLGQHTFSTTSATQRIFNDKHVETI